jgi:hypothetical protein
VVVTLDGDGATDPGELPRYVAALQAGADVAFGSRYREGGRDLTGGRFRRSLNLALAWLLNVLYGSQRTDPGFGYAAFWRDALENLTLPSPAPAAPATWGDGPEIEALLAVRAAARGLTVTEVPGVAYPRMRRSSHADRTTIRHWLRALLSELRHRTARPARHSATASTDFSQPSTVAVLPPSKLGQDRRSLPNRRIPLSDRREATPADKPAGPIWGPPRRDPEPNDLWLADIPAPLDRPARPLPPEPEQPVIASAPVPRTGEAGRTSGESMPEEPREVGARRRHLEGYRQRPDLRVINGEGGGSGRSRSGRLRAVPPRETTGGRPGPQ